MNNKQAFYSFFQSITHSFRSQALYQDAAYNWPTKGFNHLWARIVLSWIIIMVLLYSMLSEFTNSYQTTEFVRSIPKFSITDGTLSADIDQPYILKYNTTPVAIVDTTGSISSLDNRKELFLFTKKAIITSDKNNTIEFNRFQNIQINDPLVLLDSIRSLPMLAILFIFPLAVIGEFLLRIVELSFFTAWIQRKYPSIPLSKQDIFRTCAVALTPGMIFSLIMWGPTIIILRILITVFIDIYYVKYAINSVLTGTDHLIKEIEAQHAQEQEIDDDDLW